jgi:multidrug/hemolysin transport system permease protein
MLLLRLVKRNILVYVRDRSNIFFSLLSMIIIIGLMVIFLGKMNADNVVSLLNEYGGVRDTAADRNNAEQLVMLWALAGIVVVNSVTITLSMIGIMVEDEAQKRLSSFYVSPVNRVVFVMGYIIAAMIMGVIICTMTVAIGEIYFGIIGVDLLTLEQLGKILFYILLNVFTSASLVFLIMNFVHTQGALSGLGTIIGTLVGFLSGIYLPMGTLPEKVQAVIKCLPLIHGSSFLRSIFTENILTTTFQNCPAELIYDYKEFVGITVTYKNEVISDSIKVAFLVISGIIFIGISAVMQRRRNVMSR